MSNIAYIASIHKEAMSFGLGKLNIKERNFIESIYQQSTQPGFAELSQKQNNWLSAIARKLTDTAGKHQYEVLAERCRDRMERFHRAYYAACW